MPPRIRCEVAASKIYHKFALEDQSLLHFELVNPPPHRLKSRKSIFFWNGWWGAWWQTIVVRCLASRPTTKRKPYCTRPWLPTTTQDLDFTESLKNWTMTAATILCTNGGSAMTLHAAAAFQNKRHLILRTTAFTVNSQVDCQSSTNAARRQWTGSMVLIFLCKTTS